MSATEVSWLKVPIVGCAGMECAVPVNERGEAVDAAGEPLPMEDRPNPCGEDGHWMLGAVFLCERHAAEVAVMMGDSIEAITAAWREQL